MNHTNDDLKREQWRNATIAPAPLSFFSVSPRRRVLTGSYRVYFLEEQQSKRFDSDAGSDTKQSGEGNADAVERREDAAVVFFFGLKLERKAGK